MATHFAPTVVRNKCRNPKIDTNGVKQQKRCKNNGSVSSPTTPSISNTATASTVDAPMDMASSTESSSSTDEEDEEELEADSCGNGGAINHALVPDGESATLYETG